MVHVTNIMSGGSSATNICNISVPGRIPSGEDLHSIEGRRLIIQRKSLAGGSSRRANLTRSCRAITLLVSTNTDDGNSAFQCSPVDTCSNGNSLPGGNTACPCQPLGGGGVSDKVGWHVASNVASGGG